MADSLSNRLLSAIGSNPTASAIAGKVGKAIDVIGTKLGNPLPQVSAFGGQGLSGALESAGSASLTPQQQVAKMEERSKTTGVAPVYTPQNVQYSSTPQAVQTNAGPMSMDSMIAEYKKRGWTDEAAIKNDIAAGGGKSYFQGDVQGAEAKPQVDPNKILAENPGSKYLTDMDVNDIFSDLSKSTEDYARAIEERASAAADREYQAVLGLLGGQKDEAKTLAGQQRERALTAKQEGGEELSAKEVKELAEIQKQKEGFTTEMTSTVETLAKNWRDLSLEVQRIARARGISDSAFASGKETDLLMDFNKGLRTLATQNLSALKDFGDASTETVQYYGREKTKLESAAKQQVEDIDNWERQTVATIQGQETMAYNKKLDAIEAAMTRADGLRTAVAQDIASKKISWEMWLTQTQYNYKLAIAQAATGKGDDAMKTWNNMRDVAKGMGEMMDAGLGSIVPQTNAQGQITGGTFKYRNPATGKDEEIGLNDVGTLSGLTSAYKSTYGSFGSDNTNLQQAAGTIPDFSTYVSNLGGGSAAPTSSNQGGLLGAIGSLFK